MRVIYRFFLLQPLKLIIVVGGLFSCTLVYAAESDNTDDVVKKAVATEVTTNTADLMRGKQIYAENCSVCHGDKGTGSKWTVNTLNPSPRDFTTPLAAIELSRERMLQAVIAGREGSAMVSYLSDLSVADIIAVVDFIRSEFMRPQDVSAYQGAHGHPVVQMENVMPDMSLPFASGVEGDFESGRDLYLHNCAACHGDNGNGQGVRKSASQPLPLDFLSFESRRLLNRPALYKGVAEGKNGTVMPAWKTVLSEQQIADVAEYVFRAFIHPADEALEQAKKKVTKN